MTSRQAYNGGGLINGSLRYIGKVVGTVNSSNNTPYSKMATILVVFCLPSNN